METAGPERIPVALVDDYECVRFGVRTQIERAGPYQVVILAEDAADYIRQSREKRVAATVVDLLMDGMDGWALIAWMREHQPEIPAVAMSINMCLDYRVRAHRAGARAMLAKNARCAEWGVALADVIERRFHLNPLMEECLWSTRTAADRSPKPRPPVPVPGPLDPESRMAQGLKVLDVLSEKELQVFRWRLVVPKLSNERIALHMNVKESTVDSHCKGISGKIGLRDRGEAISFVERHGLRALLDPETGMPM